jgi:transcriptional regulator with XRE-family HTH domain
MARHPSANDTNPLARFKGQHELTDEQLGEQLGLDRTHISRLRRGKRKPSLQTALKIARETEGEIPVEAWSL